MQTIIKPLKVREVFHNEPTPYKLVKCHQNWLIDRLSKWVWKTLEEWGCLEQYMHTYTHFKFEPREAEDFKNEITKQLRQNNWIDPNNSVVVMGEKSFMEMMREKEFQMGAPFMTEYHEKNVFQKGDFCSLPVMVVPHIEGVVILPINVIRPVKK